MMRGSCSLVRTERMDMIGHQREWSGYREGLLGVHVWAISIGVFSDMT